LKRKAKRRLPARIKAPLIVPARPNEIWSADFMADALWSRRRFRTFNVLDDFNRKALQIEVDTSLPSAMARGGGLRSSSAQGHPPPPPSQEQISSSLTTRFAPAIFLLMRFAARRSQSS
jgi:hypothetical protein